MGAYYRWQIRILKICLTVTLKSRYFTLLVWIKTVGKELETKILIEKIQNNMLKQIILKLAKAKSQQKLVYNI